MQTAETFFKELKKNSTWLFASLRGTLGHMQPVRIPTHPIREWSVFDRSRKCFGQSL